MHLRAARVLRRLGPPGPQPAPALARVLRQLQRRGPGERLHALPADLALLRRPGQELRGGPPVLGALHHFQYVLQVLVRARHADVEQFLAYEAVVGRVGGVGGAGRDEADAAAAPAQYDGADDRRQHAQGDQEPENLHGSIVPDAGGTGPGRGPEGTGTRAPTNYPRFP